MENFDYYRVEKAIQYIEANYKSQPSLEEIADHVCLSPFHFQRLFKDWAGVSPKKFIVFDAGICQKSTVRQSVGF